MSSTAALPSATPSLSWAESPDSSAQRRTWILAGDLDLRRVRALDEALRRSLPASGGSLTLELSEVRCIDSVGTATLVHLWRTGRERGFTLVLLGVRKEVQDYLELYRVVDQPGAPAEQPGLLASLGERTWNAALATLEFLVLAADVTLEALSSLFRPWRMRWASVIEQCSLMGSQALGIVGLITFLVGLTLAFQSAYQLRQFGAAIYVASLTAISVVREMGPLITAILVAGRSGSSITSEVATMKVNEEIDALEVMGIPFVDYVAVPRLVGLMAMVPLLTLLADVLGIAGGWLVSITYLDLTSRPYLQATLDALVLRDLMIGLIKSISFAWGISLIGLYYGLRVSGGAQEVGKATTSSVVSSIFFIIVADSVYSILFYVVLK